MSPEIRSQQLLYKQAALESIVTDMKKGWLANNINSKSPELAKQIAELGKLIEAIKKEVAKVEEESDGGEAVESRQAAVVPSRRILLF